jgi:aminopeptidase N
MYQKAARARRGGKDRPIVDRSYASPDTMFDSRAYPKGAWVLHMIRQRLGDDQFWEVLNKYGSRHAYGTVETVDLRKVIEEVSGRSFERFFYDWTDRPGHPEVTVKYQWMNDDKLAKVTVKQTQEADAFHFPLALEFRFENGGQPVRVAPDITEKEESFYYSLAAKPVMFRVDPEQAVLMDLKEQKGSDLWKYQLTGDPDPIGRIRAARHFADSESDADRRLLADALASEKFRGVQQEIAESLAESGGDIARDALIAGLKLGNHKVRRTCVSSLATFRDDPAVLAAIRPMVAEGDASYYVEAEAIETYSKLEADDAYDLLTAALNRDSRTEVIRNAVLSGLGRLRDERVVSVLSEWTRPGKPRFCRPTALRALGDVTKRIPLDDSTVQSIVDTLAAALDDTGSRVRGQAVNSLGAIQDPGRAFTALPALRAMAANDASSRVRRGAERAMQAVESGKPAQVQLADLREELKEALEQNESMADRIERLEKRLADVDEKNAKSAAVAATDSEPAGEAN